MNYLILSGNPKKGGLCDSVQQAVIQGAEAGGANVELFTTQNISRCRVCGDGWGTCRQEHECVIKDDDFSAAQEKIRRAELLCMITPVYWGEMAEGLKTLADRLRRCEAQMLGGTEHTPVLKGKQVLLIASPGGSGNGMTSCLQQMEQFCRHTGAVIFDYIGINRWNHDYKKTAVYEAAKAMSKGRIAGETLEM